MAAIQPDLFGTPSHPDAGGHDAPSCEIVALVRTRLHAALALVQGAAAMPWPDQMGWTAPNGIDVPRCGS